MGDLNAYSTRCPHCTTDLRGDEIPNPEAYGGRQFYDRTIGVEISSIYDGILFYECPDCGGRWQRWPVGHPLHEKARPYVAEKGEVARGV